MGTWNPIRLLRGLWSEREVVVQLTRREVESTYRESVLGLLWLLVQPLLSLAVYAFVFTTLFQPRAPEGSVSRIDFVIRMFCGMIIYWAFSEVVGRSPTLVLAKPSYVKNIVFPLRALAISVLGKSLVGLLAGILILLFVIGIVHQTVSVTVFLFPLVLVPLVLLTLGVSWLLASIGVFLRDVQPGVRVVLQLMFFATPIVWTPEILPPRLQPLVIANPLATIIDNARRTLVLGAWPDWGMLAITTVFCGFVFLAGHAWFERTKHGFADVM